MNPIDIFSTSSLVSLIAVVTPLVSFLIEYYSKNKKESKKAPYVTVHVEVNGKNVEINSSDEEFLRQILNIKDNDAEVNITAEVKSITSES